LGLPGVTNADTFLAAAALNRRGSYNSALTADGVNAFIRGGFSH
jgi:hypothetical protein